jgi:excisionase family DNA binding protein
VRSNPLQLHRSAPTPAAGDGASSAGPVVLLLTAREAAHALAISERTLWGLTQRGEVQVVRIGRSVRYAVAELERYVAHLCEEQAAQQNGRPG